MFWKKQMMSETLALTVSLFLIGALHTLIFGTFQYPSNFIIGPGFKHIKIYANLILYSSAIIGSFCYQILCRNFGLKNALIGGLCLNLFGLLFLWINQYAGGILTFLFLDMLCFGLALTWVINGLITFIILKFPRKTGAGITGLFAVLNGGIMLAPLLLGVFKDFGIEEVIFPFLMLWTVIAIWHVEKRLYDPPYPAHLKHLRKGTLIWKELHYRLGLYFLAIVLYGMVESSFSMWGFNRINRYLGESVALETVPVYFLFLIIGQILVLIPLYLYSPKKVFYGLVLVCAFSLNFLFHQQILFGFVAAFALGGIGCSAIFPILISMMEKELSLVAAKRNILPYIETGVSFLLGAYYLGNGINDIWIEWFKESGSLPHFNLPLGISIIVGVGLIGLGLSLTAPRRGSLS